MRPFPTNWFFCSKPIYDALRERMRKAFISVIQFYQRFISPLKPPACRFYPSCSEYTRQALEQYGLFKGSLLGIKRICRCHPFHPGGVDPLP